MYLRVYVFQSLKINDFGAYAFEGWYILWYAGDFSSIFDFLASFVDLLKSGG